MSCPVVAFVHGFWSGASALVVKVRPAFGDQSALRKQNRACDSTDARTNWAPNAGGQVRSAAM
jgi:hypothetical protein